MRAATLRICRRLIKTIGVEPAADTTAETNRPRMGQGERRFMFDLGFGITRNRRRNGRRALDAAILPALLAIGGFGCYGVAGDTVPGGAGGGADTTAGGGGNDTTAGGGGDDNTPPPEVVPRKELTTAIKSRDAAKKSFRAALTLMGLDPAVTKIIATDDEENPYRVEVDGEDKTEEIRLRLAGNKTDKPGKNAALDEANRKLNRIQNAANVQIGGLAKTVEKLALLTPLRAAFAAAGAVDSGGDSGEFTDLITLAGPFLKCEIIRDDDGAILLDGGAAQVKITPLDDKGQPMVDATGNAVTLQKFAEKFLEKRQHLKKSNSHNGPGAGGYGRNGTGANGAGNGQNKVDGKDAARNAGLSMFGLGAK